MSYRFVDSLRAGSGRNHFRPDPDPKHVEFSQNKFEKLVHLVGFIIRIYRDARSPERQKRQKTKKNIFKIFHSNILLDIVWYLPYHIDVRKVEMELSWRQRRPM